MRRHRTPRGLLPALYWTLWSVPLLALGSLYGFVLHARLHLGEWPQPYRPDPKDLPFSAPWMLAAHFALAALPVSLLGMLGLPLLFRKRLLNDRRFRLSTGAYFSLFVLTLLLLWKDPGRFQEWFAD